ncbi:hypothetical protein H2248_006041 [Termitomyces sp. 'cryptogamus']|nr:hypothetical protein H2248_006041 [Termitomyces sp. 'cryptogamus']
MWDVLRDDTFKFYAVILTISIANATVWFVFRPEWFRLLQGFFTAAICVMGGRLVLSLRGAYYRYSLMDLDNDEATTIEHLGNDSDVMPLQELNAVESHQICHRIQDSHCTRQDNQYRICWN